MHCAGIHDDGLVGGDDKDMIAGRDGDDLITLGAGTDSANGGLGEPIPQA